MGALKSSDCLYLFGNKSHRQRLLSSASNRFLLEPWRMKVGNSKLLFRRVLAFGATLSLSENRQDLGKPQPPKWRTLTQICREPETLQALISLEAGVAKTFLPSTKSLESSWEWTVAHRVDSQSAQDVWEGLGFRAPPTGHGSVMNPLFFRASGP